MTEEKIKENRRKYLRFFGFGLLVLLVVALLGALSYFSGRYYDENREKISFSSSLESLRDKIFDSNPKIIVFGDTRTGHDAHQKIANAIFAEDPIAVFNVGDLVEDGNAAAEWDTFNNIEKSLIKNTNYYSAAGNHEKESRYYYNNFEFPGNEKWYSVNYLGIHFVVLNSNVAMTPGSEQAAWLEKDLSSVGEKMKFKAIVIHQPVYETGPHYKDEKSIKGDLLPIIEKYKVNAVFAGHDHDYERLEKNGTSYIITGGGGAPLSDKATSLDFSQKFLKEYHFCVLQVAEGKIKVKVINIDGKTIDEFDID